MLNLFQHPLMSFWIYFRISGDPETSSGWQWYCSGWQRKTFYECTKFNML